MHRNIGHQVLCNPQEPPTNPRYVDLKPLGIKTPPGWSNRPEDLELDVHFVTGESVHGVLEYHGFCNIRPVITEHGEVFVIQAERNGKRNFFTWHYIWDRLAMVMGDLGLKEVVRIVGIDFTVLDFSYIAYPDS